MSALCRPLLVAIALVAVATVPARALVGGEACTLQSPLPVTVERGRSRMDTSFERGTEVSVVYVGEDGRAQISNGDLKGMVMLREVEAACAGTLRSCTAKAPFSLYERNRSDSTSWPVTPGTAVSVLRTGKVWAHLVVRGREGFALVSGLDSRCASGGEAGDDAASPVADDPRGPPVEEVDRGDGPGILLLPFVADEGSPAARADQLFAAFAEHLAYYRPDVGQLPLLGSRTVVWKEHIDSAVRRARASGHAYALLGRLGSEGGVAVVSIALVDVATGRTVKGVRARPKAVGDDDWSDPALAALLPSIPPAPGSRLPTTRSVTATAPADTAAPAPAAIATTGEDWLRPWFANPWGYVALAAGAAAGVGSGLMGQQALATNAEANATAVTDEARGLERRRALEQAIVADGLAVVAGVASVAAVVVFAGRVGLGE
ncbi:MAG: hypothetical protein FJ137_01560 [Deltaproteobacteria bacterium]|nr:hypothetical protein [Deltaproteobacteria bacterium]